MPYDAMNLLQTMISLHGFLVKPVLLSRPTNLKAVIPGNYTASDVFGHRVRVNKL